MNKLLKKGFTLIELLIVIGILGVLIVTVLVTLNPLEAQKKARDAKRMKDVATMQSIIEQYINEGNASICTAAAGCTTAAVAAGTQSQPCAATNWLTVDLCKYANTIPVDPGNGTIRKYITGGTTAAPLFCGDAGQPACVAVTYQFKMQGVDYELNVRQESASSANNVLNDGGNSTLFVEAGSLLTLF